VGASGAGTIAINNAKITVKAAIKKAGNRLLQLGSRKAYTHIKARRNAIIEKASTSLLDKAQAIFK
jgi:urease beta subunit